jgi:hypothetical protein
MASNDRAPAHDDRWGDHVPSSLRYAILVEKGDVKNFLMLLATSLHRFFDYNEAKIRDIDHFLARLVSESLRRFYINPQATSANNVSVYFWPDTIETEASNAVYNDPEERTSHLQGKKHEKAIEIRNSTRPQRKAAHWRRLVAERFEVLQSIFVLLQHDSNYAPLNALIREVRRFAAESGVWLDVKGNPPTLVPLEEPLLQKEVLDRLLPRLEAKFPDRAADLIRAYHDLLQGVDTNTVFGNAFKALEALARDISGDQKLKLSKESEIRKYFPKLHGTIQVTITKLAAQRGDEGAHGRLGPDEYEIRYVLFTICNVALVLLEYKEHGG